MYYAQLNCAEFWRAVFVKDLMSIKFIISILQTVHDSQKL